MAQPIVDEVALREPRLLVPGRQPLGPVRVDWSNPIARDLKSVILPGPNGKLVDLISRARPTSDGSTVRTGPVGRGAEYDSTNVTEFAGTTAYRVTTNFTIALMFDLDAATNYSHLAGCQESSTTNGWELRGGVGATGTEIDIGRLQAGYYFWVGASGTIAVGLNKVVLPLENDLTHQPTIIANGKPVTLSAGANSITGYILAGTGNLRFGQRPDGVTKLDGAVYGFMLWHRKLSLAEAAAIDADFWQLLIPA